MVVGGLVIEGKLISNCKAVVYRDKQDIAEGKIVKLQIGKQDEKQVPEGTECGLQFEGKEKLQEGDILVAYTEEIRIKKLEE